MTAVEISAGGPLRGILKVPGDKSVSHRSLLLGARASGTSRITGLSRGEDVRRTRFAVEAFGASITEDKGCLYVDGGLERLHEPATVIDLGNSGTGMRLMTGWAAGLPGLAVLTGDESLNSRPMLRVVEPLRHMGANILGRGGGQWAPLVISPGQLKGGEYTSPVASAQVKSAILLAGLAADGETTVHEPVLTRTHTEELLLLAGADVRTVEHPDGAASITVTPSELKAFELEIPADPSQAAFWMVGALVVPESDITLERVYLGPGRGGMVDVLVRMGADIELQYHDATTADVRVRHSELSGVDVAGDEVPSLIDELPVLAVAAAFAEGRTVITDAEEMRVKESDRIAAVASEIGGLGANIEEQSDGWVISGSPGRPLNGGRVRAGLDHRIAMTGAIAALTGSAPTVIEGWESVATSYPDFLGDLAALRERT